MKTETLMRKVPWKEMYITSQGYIRRRKDAACPICAALGLSGKSNAKADIFAADEGMDMRDAEDIIGAADAKGILDPFLNESQVKLRKSMERRMQRAQR